LFLLFFMVTQKEVMGLVDKCVLREAVTGVQVGDMAEKRIDLTLAINECYGDASKFRQLDPGTEMPLAVASAYDGLRLAYGNLQAKTDKEIRSKS
jgi:hypothetical protein